MILCSCQTIVERIGKTLSREFDGLDTVLSKWETLPDKRSGGAYLTSLMAIISSLAREVFTLLSSSITYSSWKAEIDRFFIPLKPKWVASPQRVTAQNVNSSMGGALEAHVSIQGSDGSVQVYHLREGETFISTESAKLTTIECSQAYNIPHTLLCTPFTIRVRINAGRVVSSKLIFSSRSKNGLRVSRRFGMDEVPIRLTENINISTDRIYVGEDFTINFKNEFVAAN